MPAFLFKKPILRNRQRFQKLLKEHLSWRRVRNLSFAHIKTSSVVIYNFSINDIAALKSKAYPPLIINTNAPLTLPAAFQGFKSVARGNSQVFYFACDIKKCQLTHGDRFKSGKPSNALSFKHRLSIPTLKRSNHESILTHYVSIVKFYY